MGGALAEVDDAGGADDSCGKCPVLVVVDRSGAEPLSEDLEGHTDVVRGGRAFSAPVAEVPGGPADGHISSITVKHGKPDGRDVAVSAPPVNRVGG